MKAVVIHKYGSADVLQYEEVEVPKIKPNELLVKVYAAGVNPVDWKIRKGMLKIITGNKFPMILGFDLAGEVIKVLKPKGVYVTTLPALQNIVAIALTTLFGTQKAKFILAQPNTADLLFLNELIETAKLRVVINCIYPLKEVAAAHIYSESERAKGKIVVSC